MSKQPTQVFGVRGFGDIDEGSAVGQAQRWRILYLFVDPSSPNNHCPAHCLDHPPFDPAKDVRAVKRWMRRTDRYRRPRALPNFR